MDHFHFREGTLHAESIALETIAESAGEVGCRLRLLFVGRQGADHPVMVPHEASAYLKFYLFLVTRSKEEV